MTAEIMCHSFDKKNQRDRVLRPLTMVIFKYYLNIYSNVSKGNGVVEYKSGIAFITLNRPEIQNVSNP